MTESCHKTPAHESTQPPATENKPAMKICCACPETRTPRDECIVRNGEENCAEFIEAHKKCLRELGFKI